MEYVDLFLPIITKYGLTKEDALFTVEKAFELKSYRDNIRKDFSSYFSNKSKSSISDKDSDTDI